MIVITIHRFQCPSTASTTGGGGTTTEQTTVTTYATSPTPGKLFLDESKLENCADVYKYKKKS